MRFICFKIFKLHLAAGAALLGACLASNAQEFSYSYDPTGHLKAITTTDNTSNAFDCGTSHAVCPTGGVCRMGTCSVTTPPCMGPNCNLARPKTVISYCAHVHCGPPAQPKLVSGGLHGMRVCSNFVTLEGVFSFDCSSPLPSNVDSGWQLTPLIWTNRNGTQHPNKAVVLTVSTPTQTELFVEFVSSAGNRIEQVQVTRQGGDAEVTDVGPQGQVAEVMADDGHTRTWTLQFLLNTCEDAAQINISSVGSSGITNGVMSNPLHVWLLRDPAELTNVSQCS